MTWERRAPFSSSPLEQAFWIATLAVVISPGKRDRAVDALLELCEQARPKARA